VSQDADLRGTPAFPSTRWSELVAGPGQGDPDGAAARAAFEALAVRYWRPVAAYVRARGARDDDEARDATQDFFVWMLESGFLARLDRSRGTFRGFIKRTLKNFLHDLERKRRTVRRGGTRNLLPLSGAEGDLDLPDPAGRDPEALLDDVWRQELLARALDGLEAELAARGKQRTFRVFRDYFLSEEELDYAAVAARHDMTGVDVSNALAAAKKRFRAHLRACVLETVGGDEDLRAELAWLFGGENAGRASEAGP